MPSLSHLKRVIWIIATVAMAVLSSAAQQPSELGWR